MATKGSGDFGKWRLCNGCMNAQWALFWSVDEGKWWEVVTKGSGDFGKWRLCNGCMNAQWALFC